MESAGDDDRWRCASCGHVHESYNPPCLRCAGERLVRVGSDADEGVAGTGETTGSDGASRGTDGNVTAAGGGRDDWEWAESGGGRAEESPRVGSTDSETDWGDPDSVSIGADRTDAEPTGWDRDPSVQYLCKSCGERYPTEQRDCRNCGSSDLAAIRELSEEPPEDGWTDPDAGVSSPSKSLFDRFSTVVAYLFGIVALFSGLGVLLIALFEGLSGGTVVAIVGTFVAGVLATSAGLVSLPATRRPLFRRLGVELSRGKLVALILLLWVGGNVTLMVAGVAPTTPPV
ncbi:hypothetical protein [Haloarchaeobius sp. TZWWS8]|uniref:hypothetical protein n=1 Tax=Haloarchaeobius sp. TZWWS8 TaxID=3446121 RepID=UPI003EBD7729